MRLPAYRLLERFGRWILFAFTHQFRAIQDKRLAELRHRFLVNPGKRLQKNGHPGEDDRLIFLVGGTGLEPVTLGL